MAAPSVSAATSSPQLPAFLRQSKAEVHAKFVDLEWQQRNRLLAGTQPPTNPSDPPSPWSRLSGDGIAARNRYLNVEPYAQNRVKLKVAEGISDYINASPIQLGKRRYIATQGPKDSSVNHFYRMVAADDIVKGPVVVVMLTPTHEAGREKCFQYYPLSPEESPLVIGEDYEIADGFNGEVVLEDVVIDEKARSERRRLRLRTTTSPPLADGQSDGSVQGEVKEKEIEHLLFSGWPDFLVPEGDDRQALIELIRLSATLNRPASTNTTAAQTNGNHASSSIASDLASTDEDNPRIIHCSAGVGRSGTFIALDYLLSLLYSGELEKMPADRDPVAETVDLLRQQRMMMVQGESQFHFVYEVLRAQTMAKLGIAPPGTGLGGGDAVGGAMI